MSQGIFITGITGTLGTEIARIHAKHRDDVVFGCCLSERNAVEWNRTVGLGKAINCNAAQLGEILSTLHDLHGIEIDRVYHCAAAKHVDLAESDPENAVDQNIQVTRAVVNACRNHGCRLVFADTDKSCDPTSIYGATKLIARRIVLMNGGAAVRSGNMIGSSGSVFHKWAECARAGRKIPVTNPHMTRFFIDPQDVARIMVAVADLHVGGLFVPKMKAARIGDLASMFGETEQIPPRPGDRLHEYSVGPDEKHTDCAAIENVLCIGHGIPGGISSETADCWDLAEFRAVLERQIGSW